MGVADPSSRVERAGPFTPVGLEYLCSSEEGVFWKRSYARSQCTPRIRTAVVSDNSRSNTKRGNKGQCLAKESALLLLRLVFTHGEDLLQDFLHIFIHLALYSIQKMHSVNGYDLLVLFLTVSQLVLQLLDLLL